MENVPLEIFRAACRNIRLPDDTVDVLVNQGIVTLDRLLGLTEADFSSKIAPNLSSCETEQLRTTLVTVRRTLLGDIPEFQMQPLVRRVRPESECLDNPLRIVLLGATGAGKSSTGNTIVGNEVFKTDSGMEAITQFCQSSSVVLDGRAYTIIDTPGLFEAKRKDTDQEREIIKSLCLASPGPHAILFFMDASKRATKQEIAGYKMLKNMFGAGIQDFIIFVFTHGDTLGEHSEKISHWAVEEIGEMWWDAKGRFVVFNNVGTERRKDECVHKILRTIDTMRSKLPLADDEKFFRSELMASVENYIEEVVKKESRNRSMRDARKLLMEKIEADKNGKVLVELSRRIKLRVLIKRAAALALVAVGAGTSVSTSGIPAIVSAVAGVVSGAFTGFWAQNDKKTDPLKEESLCVVM